MLRLVRPESGLTAVPVPCNGRPGRPQLRSKVTVQILPVSGFRFTRKSSPLFIVALDGQVSSPDGTRERPMTVKNLREVGE